MVSFFYLPTFSCLYLLKFIDSVIGISKRVLRRIFGPKRDEVTAGWRKLHSEELHGLYSSIIRMIKLRKMRWTGHVARMGGDEKCVQHFG
jgi:hypothetical protein